MTDPSLYEQQAVKNFLPKQKDYLFSDSRAAIVIYDSKQANMSIILEQHDTV